MGRKGCRGRQRWIGKTLPRHSGGDGSRGDERADIADDVWSAEGYEAEDSALSLVTRRGFAWYAR